MSQDTDQPQQQEQGAQPQPQQQEEQQKEQQQQQQKEDKNVQDKKEIADEEREKMLNAENSKHMGAAPGSDLEAEEHKPKRKIPIGGIKMPGFCRSSKSKEPSKDDDTKPIEDGEGKDGEDKANHAPSEGVVGRTGRLFQAIRVPLSNVFSRKKKEADAELGTTGASAGLASSETLDGVDANQEKNNVAAAVGEDGMETVRLDVEAGDSPPLKPHPLLAFLAPARRYYRAIGATIAVLLVILLILLMSTFGPSKPMILPVIDGKIMTQTTCGPVQGIQEENAFVFRGIPYARPPINERRWKRAEPLDNFDYCWNGTKLAYNSSEMCWQRNLTTGRINGVEDCLYLDIFTPRIDRHNPVAVVVMIGADTLSGPSPGIMQPSGNLAHDFDIVFVRPNFRLDVFGFFAGDVLSRDSVPQTSGNYGLHDIITVLQWVKLNIEHFGGNKDMVTVWGHRAGGTLVTALLGARQAKGLFSKAWISSASANFPTNEIKEYESLNKPFLDKLNCNGVPSPAACLRNKKAEEVMEAVPHKWYEPNDGKPARDEESNIKTLRHQWLVKDNELIQQHIGDILKQENLPFKIMLGTTEQSGSILPLRYNTSDDNPKKIEEEVRNSLFATKANYTEKIYKKYNKTLKALHTMISEVRVICPLASYALMNVKIPFYISTFPRKFVADADSDAAAILGFFENNTVEKRRHYTAMQQLFKYFVYHGKVDKLEEGSGQKYLIINQDVHIQSNYETCDPWVEIGPAHGRID